MNNGIQRFIKFLVYRFWFIVVSFNWLETKNYQPTTKI